jgi:outer membrane protein assembly factor BamB
VEPGETLYVGIRGSVLALDRKTGEILWQRQLKGWETPLLAWDGAHVYASVVGEVFCLNAQTGQLLWENPLRGLGTGICTLLAPGGVSSEAPPVLIEQAREEARRRSSSSGNPAFGTT